MRPLILAFALISAPAFAQTPAANHAGMNHGAMQNTAANPFAQSDMKMHDAMMKAMGADVSETFIRKMIEHHRGAVDMSRIALAQAKDREARGIAQKTITMQGREIAEMQSWLKRHGKRPQ